MVGQVYSMPESPFQLACKVLRRIFLEAVSGQEVMVSFDVKSLFTSIPIDRALDVINRRLKHWGTDQHSPPGHVTMLLGICLKTTYFMYHRQFYEQMEGAIMGSLVSPVIANIFMEFVEKTATDTPLTDKVLEKKVCR